MGVTPLNDHEEIKGVFLCASLFRGNLPDRSPYGTDRFIFSINELFYGPNGRVKSLFLAGFYQLKENESEPYYVILVLSEEKISPKGI